MSWKNAYGATKTQPLKMIIRKEAVAGPTWRAKQIKGAKWKREECICKKRQERYRTKDFRSLTKSIKSDSLKSRFYSENWVGFSPTTLTSYLLTIKHFGAGLILSWATEACLFNCPASLTWTLNNEDCDFKTCLLPFLILLNFWDLHKSVASWQTQIKSVLSFVLNLFTLRNFSSATVGVTYFVLAVVRRGANRSINRLSTACSICCIISHHL